jgi:hypothetical protein
MLGGQVFLYVGIIAVAANLNGTIRTTKRFMIIMFYRSLEQTIINYGLFLIMTRKLKLRLNHLSM